MAQPIPSTRKTRMLGVDLDLIDYDGVFQILEHWRQAGRRNYITMTNPHSMLLFHRDKDMRRATARATLTLPDGAGIIFGANLLGYPHSGRITGPMLMLKLCDWGRRRGYRHYFLGGQQGVAEALTRRLVERYPGLQIAGVSAPHWHPSRGARDKDVIEKINAARADIVWVGLGAPKQEKWIAQHRDYLNAAAMIGVGAAFDFHSGRVKWAPAWVRGLGMEWAYRFAREPRRMWPRNLDGLRFVFGVVRQRLLKTFNANTSPPFGTLEEPLN